MQANHAQCQGDVTMHARIPEHRARYSGMIWLAVLFLASALPARADAPPRKITVGTVTLKYCNSDYGGYCGSVQRAFDPTGGVKGSIAIGFEYYPRFDQRSPAWGTLVPQEGGPGYSTTGT